MKSIKELREICQLSCSSSETWYGKYVERKISIYITWLILHTSITPNQVTLLYLIFGMIGGILLIPGIKILALVGIILLQIGYILDCVDGEVARYRNQASIYGIFLDVLTTLVVGLFLWVGFGFYCYFSHGGIFSIILGCIAGICSFRTVKSIARETVFFYAIEGKEISSFNYKDTVSIEDHLYDENRLSENNIIEFFSTLFYPNIVLIPMGISIILSLILKNNIPPIVVLVTYGILTLIKAPLSLWLLTRNNWIEKTFLKLLINTKRLIQKEQI